MYLPKYEDICIKLFIEALAVTARYYNQLRCSYMVDWYSMTKLWYVYTVEYYGAVEKDKEQTYQLIWGAVSN